ncbi:Glutathione S-transferase family protein [Sulfidibacter corallicola]|uniref:Glutathione S-transferase family protein n=1 Tax=Sulfidibacter corallicola TaxID=2818388 RepID=A0A8A4TFJ9_SULCO|nr:glutathione S-transferase family protein [Sulfidibacter corallicola]QTD48330.1 glutathione S-transferase family protein [Sulfidibacter corallicola]
MTVVLYQFMVSHYCERSRWTLDFKQVPYHLVNWIPGPHIKQARGLGFNRSQVPILDYQGQRMQGSDVVARFLEERHPERPLWLDSEAGRAEINTWQKRIDEEIGVPLRALIYGDLMKHRNTVIDLWCQEKGLGSRMLCHLLYGTLKKKLVYYCRLAPEFRADHVEKLARGLDELDEAYGERAFLVGDRFTFADLSAAALAAPLIMPSEHQVNWPAKLPQSFEELRASHAQRPTFQRVLELYREFRLPTMAGKNA